MVLIGSFSQTERPPVIFSPSFDNLIKSKYIESTKTYKNVGLVAGEGEGSARKNNYSWQCNHLWIRP